MADKKTLEIHLRMRDLATRELKRVQGVASRFGSKLTGMFKSVGRSVMSLKGMIVGLVAVLAMRRLINSFVEAAATTEQLGIRMRVLLGSAEEGAILFKDLTEWAGKVPFEYQQIMDSATMLAGIMKEGRKEIMEWLPLIGDLAAATGLTITKASEQVMRMLSAGAASADMFR